MSSPKRVGLLVPSSNTVMEVDLHRTLAHVATVHTARMFLDEPVTAEKELELLDRHAQSAARELATLDPDIVVFGCTSAATMRGREADARLRSELSDLAGAPALGVFDLITDALRSRTAHRIALLTPYGQDHTAQTVEGFRDEGFEVVASCALGLDSNLAVGRIKPSVIASEAVALLREAPPVDALVLACTNLRSLEARSQIESACGIEIVTSNSAVVARTLDLLTATQPSAV